MPTLPFSHIEHRGGLFRLRSHLVLDMTSRDRAIPTRRLPAEVLFHDLPPLRS